MGIIHNLTTNKCFSNVKNTKTFKNKNKTQLSVDIKQQKANICELARIEQKSVNLWAIMYDVEHDIKRFEKKIKLSNVLITMENIIFDKKDNTTDNAVVEEVMDEKKCKGDPTNIGDKYKLKLLINKYIDTYVDIMDLMEDHTTTYINKIDTLGIKLYKSNRKLNKYNLKHLDHHLENTHIKAIH
jgi:hypothetical protein